MNKNIETEKGCTIRPLHVELKRGSENGKIDPGDCKVLSLFCICSKSGVKRLEAAFRERSDGGKSVKVVSA